MPFKKIAKLSCLLLPLALLGCAKEPSPASAQTETQSRQLIPADTALAEIYNRSCSNCHTIAATGAPLTGDVAAWAPRLEQGMDTLVLNVVNGIGGMPPFGLCMDCNEQEFSDLISFMAEPAPEQSRTGD